MSDTAPTAVPPPPKHTLNQLSEMAWRLIREQPPDPVEAQAVARAFLNLDGVMRRSLRDLSLVEANAPADYRAPIGNVKSQIAHGCGLVQRKHGTDTG